MSASLYVSLQTTFRSICQPLLFPHITVYVTLSSYCHPSHAPFSLPKQVTLTLHFLRQLAQVFFFAFFGISLIVED